MGDYRKEPEQANVERLLKSQVPFSNDVERRVLCSCYQISNTNYADEFSFPDDGKMANLFRAHHHQSIEHRNGRIASGDIPVHEILR